MTRGTQDNLEKFVQQNKDQFDVLEPKDSIWKGVKSELEVSSKTKFNLVLWRAAAIILFVFSLGLTFYVNKDSIVKGNQKLSNNSEFVTTEKYYTSIIQEREQLVKAIAVKYPDLEIDFESDWNTLDDAYIKLKREYKQNKSDEVLHALVQNLQARVNLLNKQLEVISQMKTEEEDHLQI